MGELLERNVYRPNSPVFQEHSNKIPIRISSPSNGAAFRAASRRRRSLPILIMAIVVLLVLSIQNHYLMQWKLIPSKDFDDSTTGHSLETNSSPSRLRLRFDWTNLSPSLELTKRIQEHQKDCSLPMATFAYRNRFGLGSDLHVYGQALAYGIHTQKRIRTVGNWTWMDQTQCRTTNEGNKATKLLGSPMSCYFATSELNCPGDVEHALSHPEFDKFGGLSKANGNLIRMDGDYDSGFLPPRTKDGTKLLDTAVVESLFTSLTPKVVQEAERQLRLVFGGKKVPKDLITVHIRWGDKVAAYENRKKKLKPEMAKVDISDYMAAIQQILDQRGRKTANVFLSTEDPEAVKHFREQIPVGWNLYIDQFLVDTMEHRIDDYNGNPRMAKEMNGRAGLLSLGSLLVAMEANDFVLTTKSNWSQLMDELRRAILDPRCGNCTSMIDLRKK